jgi:putative inorganic carbon (HCO3(-)) transporter
MRNKMKYSDVIKDKKKIILAFVLSIVFLLITLLLISNGPTLLWIVPLILFLILLAIVAVDKFLLLTVFLVPVSIQLRFIIPDVAADIFIPTELMLFGILIIMIFKIFGSKEINRNLLVHPVSLVCFLMLVWSFLTSLTGTMLLVSLKSLLMKLWFFAGFYLLAAEIFSKREKIKTYFLAYFLGMIPVLIFFLLRMWKAGIFNQKDAYAAIWPIFNDHTSFGAALAFCIPVIIYLLTSKMTSKMLRVILLFMLIIFFAAFIFSYSRAAWLSLAVAFVFAAIVLLRISWKLVFIITGVLIFILIMSWTNLMIRLNENKQESSGNIGRHLQSIVNIRSDVSNMERLNRWKSALRMFREKPLLGWGPATYQFHYAPYQHASEKTIISTNYGEGGNAHSEYLSSLIDSGVPGLVFYVALLIITIIKGMKILGHAEDKDLRMLILALMAGLITYIIHGGLNNFLDTDKISALFWGIIASIVATDIKLKDEKEKTINKDRQQ